MRQSISRRFVRSWVLVALVAGSAATTAAAQTRRVALDGQVSALLTGGQVYAESYPLRGEGIYSFTRRLCGDDSHWRTVSVANGNVRKLAFGARYRVPVEVVRPDLRYRVLRALFPDDELVHDAWAHRVAGGTSLRSIARWFTGAESTSELQRENGLTGEPEAGSSLRIPARLLRPELQSHLPARPQYELSYGEDPRGKYAAYRLTPGEALYSAVVVRFTGRVYAEEVNALAAQIAERSGIADVTDIPIGYQVKIPYDMLLPEFLPPGDPRRVEWEAGRQASAQYRNEIRTSSLAGVTVVLDPGHGGKDVGASLGGVWESLYVYDIMVRLKQLLEARTAATVYATTREGSEFRVSDRDVIPYSRGHRVMTTPPYSIEDSRVAAHLRWYLANSHYRRAAQSGNSQKIIFLSIHADSLHPSLRGTMIYVPAAQLRGGSYGKSGGIYNARQEYREAPRVNLSRSDVVKSEGLSRQLAQSLIGSMRDRGIMIHKDKPIRDRIIRRRAYVPAVLRYNRIPAEVLVEVCNLANRHDRALIQTQRFRQQVAEALLAGILDYYGESEPVQAAGG